jgi:lysyl-tRNA synthetase, class II
MSTETTPIEQIISLRKEKLKKLAENGVNPFPSVFKCNISMQELSSKFAHLKPGEEAQDTIIIAGRITSQRQMGKACFLDLTGYSGKIQVYLRSDIIGPESYKLFNDFVDISDFMGAEGTPFCTRTGELSIKAQKWTLLSKSLRPLPEKWHGLKDIETRYRQRYLDLLANHDVKKIFVNRSLLLSTLRSVLVEKGFLEVETPIMQSIAGGAAAKPFITHHNSLDIDLYLRIAPELFLKRLVVGGLEKVFEIGKNFRNEGIDRTHNPEFTMLEVYQAYANYEDMMDLCELLITKVAEKLGVPLSTPFNRLGFSALFKEATGIDFDSKLGTKELMEIVKEKHLDAPKDANKKKLIDCIFDQLVLPKFTDPTFIVDYPAEYSPLAKTMPDNPEISQRFELFVKGKEVANAYTEQNDPVIQAMRFKEQMDER